MRTHSSKSSLFRSGLAAAVLLVANAAFAQAVNLTAAPTQAVLPDGQSIPMWGYTCGAVTQGSTPGTSCAAANAAAGANWSPVVITVPYTESAPGVSSTSLTINLVNNLSFQPPPVGGVTPPPNNIPTSIVIDGQLGGGLGSAATFTASPDHSTAQTVTWPAADPTPTGAPPTQGPRVQSFATEVLVGTPASPCWGPACSPPTPGLRPGTYLIHSGTHPSIQHPMGLYGVLIVTAAPADNTSTGTAYPGVAYNADVALLLSEIDPVQNRAVNAAVRTTGFSETKVWSGMPGMCGDLSATASAEANTCYPPAVNYDPRYFLINGTSFDMSNPMGSLYGASPADTTSGSVLIRLVNAGLRMHVPSIVGSLTGPATAPVLGFSLVAEDGNPLPGAPRVQSEVFLAAGKTYDVMVNGPVAGSLPVFDRQLSLSTNNQRNGGMLAYVSTQAPTAGLLPTTAVTATAVADAYSVVQGNTLTVSDPAKGVLANDVGIYSAQVVGAAPAELAFNANGTFTFASTAATVLPATFTYCGNGATSGPACALVTISACTGACLGVAPVASDVQFRSNVAARYASPPPGVLGSNVANASGLPLTAQFPASPPAPAAVTLNADGSFVATGPGAACPALSPPAPAGATCLQFPYQAKTSTGLTSNGATATVVFLAPSNLAVNVKDAKTGLAITDYRWIIEEDRTFYVDPATQTNNGGAPIPTLGTNFHTSHMPVVASGCVGAISCEAGQTLQGAATVCDVGNGVCRLDGTQLTAVLPTQVYLDPAKRYYVSVLPGDGVNTTLGGATGPVEDPPGSGKMRQFDIAKDCGPFDPSAGTAWEPGGANAMCGHAMGGAQIPAGATRPAISISLQQTPLPTAKISVMVFQDDFPLNGEQDAGGGVDILAPNEAGLSGFELKLFDQAGGFGDSTGQITYDMFNMPVSNSLAGTIDPITGKDACPISKNPDGLVGMIPTCPKFESDGTTLSPLAGQAVIANLYPGLYEVVAAPGADRIARGEEWLQTNTLDGTKAHEAFIKPNEPGYFQEFGPGGYHVAIGFANPAIINARKASVCAAAGGVCPVTVTGKVTNARMSRTPDQRVYSSGDYTSYSFTQCYVSLGPPDGADFAFAKCKADGTFQFDGIPYGNYKITVFDQWNDLLVDGLSTPIVVGGGADLLSNTTNSQCTGNPVTACSYEIPVTQWRTNLYTRTFLDLGTGTAGSPGYGDGVSNIDANGNPIEPGLPLVSTNIRYRDGSYGFFNNTDLNGFAGFNEVFPFLNWLVVETDTTRFKPTGVHVVNDTGGPVDGTTGGGTSTIAAGFANTIESPTAHLPTSLRIPGGRYCLDADCTTAGSFDPTSGNPGSSGRVDPPWAGTQGWQGLLGQNSFIEWGMKPFVPHENGGIKGHVIYASTRPFDDPTLLLQLSWEPAVPNVTLNLYQVGTAPDGSRSLTLVDTTQTTSWDDWAQGFRRNADGSLALDGTNTPIPNMSCPGQETNSPFYFTLLDSKQWLNPTTPLAERARFKCYDGWSMLNQVQPAPYDGMYKFPSVVAKAGPTGQLPATTDAPILQLDARTYKTNCTICTANPDDGTPMLPPGKYVVEVIVPPGFELVKEEDKNILLGDVYIAPISMQFAGLGNIFIMPDQAAINAYYNKNNPGGINRTTNLGATPRHEGDTGSVETFWPCVGATRQVPDYMSLFPTSGQNAPFAGAMRPLCDRKEVTLEDQMTALAKFYVFSSTHVAGHFTGTITNDFASEFDPFSPQFGEKFAPPNLPVAMRDFAGNEVSRVYADQWGIINGLYFSTYGVNPPNPTGYVPQMAIACMNDPGPILDTRATIVNSAGQTVANPTFGQMITDPLYSPAYSNFCYETPFMPGQTQYMDTPVIPTMAFADNYNLPDCEYPDTTPAVKSVVNTNAESNASGSLAAGRGPWVSNATNPPTTHRLTITALGDNPVLNHAYSGPQASTTPFNKKFVTRHYGFGTCTPSGATTGPCTVTITNPAGNPVALGGVTWSDTTITGFVPPAVCPSSQLAAGCKGQLVITAANGKRSVDTVTVSVGGKAPTYVDASSPSSTTFGQTFPNPLQTAIDNAAPGDLIIVGPGTYRENLLVWKPIRLQGVGAASVTINADAHPAGKLDSWRRQVDCLFGLSLNGRPLLNDGSFPADVYDATGTYQCPVSMQQRVDRIPFEAVVGWDTAGNGNLAQLLQEPTLMGAYEGAGITVLGRGIRIPDGSTDFWGSSTAGGFPAGYLYLTNSTADCTASATRTDGLDYGTSNFLCRPSRIDGLSVINSSQGGGAIFLHAWNHNMEISNNRITANHGTLTGGITVGNGEFPDPFIAGSGANPFPDPVGVAAGVQLGYGFEKSVNVHHNYVAGNASIGDALYSGTPSAAGGVTFCSGSDNYRFNFNWVCGNLSTGDAAGVAHAGFSDNGTITHNAIIFNQSSNPTIPTHGGGLGILGASPDVTINGIECGNNANDTDCPPGLPEGTGHGLVIDANLIMGNSAESGSGGGLRLQSVNGQEVVAFPTTPAQWYAVSVTNNIIANNVAGWDGGGVSLQDALKVSLVNNTVVHNDTTASAGVLFNTLGAPMASTPPPGCVQDPVTHETTCTPNPITTSTPQAAGLVTMANTPNLLASLPAGTQVVCPANYGYGSTLTNGSCRSISLPRIANDLFWQNRTFHIEVGGFGGGLQSQQHLVSLVPLLNQTFTGMCATSGLDQNGAPVNVAYWDIGVRGDTGPTNHASGFTLTTSTTILSTGTPNFVREYCNGSRLPPEGGGNAGSYGANAGRSETTGLSPVFALNNITPAATVDEGNNWINLGYGPLSVVHPVDGQTVLGNYAITTGSTAINAGANLISAFPTTGVDFLGTTRPQGPQVDIGAVEFAATGPIAVASVTGGPLAFGNVTVGTTSAAKTLTLHNTGNATLSGITLAFSAPQYSRPAGAAGGTCGATLGQNQTCTINVVFKPTATGPVGADLTITANVLVTGSPVPLSGTGVAPL